MRYGSVCSGIEAASAAWHPLDWQPVFFSEIEAFPCAVLAHHYPNTPNLGDMAKFEEWPDATLDVLVGGTPCQSFSVAGLRKGLDDPRGNLMLTFGAIARKYRPEWLVWENVPGVLSSNGGRDFGTFLGMLGELGYGFAYRVLDAQYFGVAQRRRRVFVIGCLGDWRRAAAVLFERHSLSGRPAPSREAGKDAAPTLDVRAGRSGETTFHTSGGLIPISFAIQAGALRTNPASGPDGIGVQADHAYTLKARAEVQSVVAFHPTQDPISSTDGITHAMGCGSKSGAATVAVALRGRDGGATAELGDEVGHALRASSGGGDKPHILTPVAFAQNSRDEVREMPYVGALAAKPGMKQTSYIRQHMQVRRLTPVECARLQGFPDHYLDITYRGKTAADGPKYKALGNSMAVPVMRWIGERLQMVSEIKVVEYA